MPESVAGTTAMGHLRLGNRPNAPWADTITMIRRSVRMGNRDIEGTAASMGVPVILLLTFVFLFGGAISTGSANSADSANSAGTAGAAAYIDYVIPGVLVLGSGFVSALTAMKVSADMHEGIIDRFRSMNVSGAAVLSGHVVASVIRNAAALLVVLVVALLLGFRPVFQPLAWLGAIGILTTYALAVSWLAATCGLLARTPAGASIIQYVLLFLPYMSSGFVPVDTMPIWLRVFAEYQPATPIIDTLRGLLLRNEIASTLAPALAWCAGLIIVSVIGSIVLFRRIAK